MQEQVDVLAIGAHPDDVEIGCGATLALLVDQGYGVGLVDLTQGEMGTNGTVAGRQQEAITSAAILGAKFRLNLRLPDASVKVEDEAVLQLVNIIRQYKPKFLLAPYWQDRHPDHVNASRLVTEANFKAGLSKLVTGSGTHRAERVAYYFINDSVEPSFVVDVASAYQKKLQALAAYGSQFVSGQERQQTRLNSGYLYLVESRDRFQGSMIGSEFGEGFVVKDPVRVKDLVEFWEGQA